MVDRAKSAAKALVLAAALLLAACGPLINIPAASGSGANVAPSADTQPTLCTAVEPIYMDRATAATLPKDLREDIATLNRLHECTCREDQRKTRECKIFLMGYR